MLRIFAVLCLIGALSAQQSLTDEDQPRRNVLYKHLSSNETVIQPLADEEYILPTTSRPLDYTVQLWTDIDQGMYDFNGKVSIEIEILEATQTIVLHVLQTTVSSIRLFNSAQDIALASYRIDTTLEFLIIQTSSAVLQPGERYFVEVEYSSVLRTAAQDGFMRSSYQNQNVGTVHIAFTQFQPTLARHAFPCYDEPALKATFTIIITHGCGHTAVSNMPEESRVESGGNYCTTTFEKSGIMSSYLIAFAVTDFQIYENYAGPIIPSITKHRVLAPTHFMENDVRQPLEWGIDILEDLEEYVNIPYSFPKIDQIGFGEFRGAMENWGLVIYDENWLYYPGVQRFNKASGVIALIAHEYGHKWFGNLVSPTEWGYLWLSEGFATLFEFLTPQRLYPEYAHEDDFVNSICYSAKNSDARQAARPMSVSVFSPTAVDRIFDFVAYDKSGCVLNMFRNAITEEVFQTALNIYLQDREYSAANPDHLSAAFHAAVSASPDFPANLNFKDILDSWHLQAGYPVINVEYTYSTGAISLTQQRYVTEGEPGSSIWYIPYNFLGSTEATNPENQGTQADGWFTTASTTIVPTAGRDWTGSQWILFNKAQSGYFRVNYDNENWKALTYALTSANHANIPHLSRSQLISDSVDFAFNNKLDFETPLSLMMYLSSEISFFPWEVALLQVTRFNNVVLGSDVYGNFLNFVNYISTAAYGTFGSAEQSNELILNNYVRRDLITWACRSGVAQCLTDTSSALVDILNNVDSVSDFLRNNVIIQGTRSLAANYYTQLWQLQQATTIATTSNLYLNALGATGSEELRIWYLQTAFIANGVSVADVPLQYSADDRCRVLSAVVNNNPSTVSFVINFLEDNASVAETLFQSAIPSCLAAFAANINSNDDLNQFVSLGVTFPQFITYVTSYASQIEARIAWLNTSGSSIREWFNEF